MKTIKEIAFAFFAVYFTIAIGDYISARHSFSKSDCALWLARSWQLHLAIPGAGNACLDKYGWVSVEK